jgi:cytoskeletal protein CcmA (bactofilin family)
MFSKGSSKAQQPTAQISSGRKLSMPSIISADLKVKGDLTSEGDIQVEGSVEGDVKSRNLTIGEAGSVKGAVETESVQVSGLVWGQIRANSVTLAKTARVFGNIWYESIAIEAGARLKGTFNRPDWNQLEPEIRFNLTVSKSVPRSNDSPEGKTAGQASKPDAQVVGSDSGESLSSAGL